MSYFEYKPTDAEHNLYAPHWIKAIELTIFCCVPMAVIYGLMLLGNVVYHML